MNRRAFFDELADRWDEIYDPERVRPRLMEGLRRFGVGPSERLVDLGCGTGVSLGCLLAHLGPEGLVTAVDLSPRMIARAKQKFPDPRIRFLVADASRLPLPGGGVERVICFSAWPHFPDPEAVILEVGRILRHGGRLHVWHVDSRRKINEIHKNAHPAVENDLLEEASKLSGRMERLGFRVEEQRDDDEAYLVTACKEDDR